MSGKAKPDSLENKFKLMQLAPFDKRMKRKHILVYGFILDWFHSKYGDALASSRHVLAELKERDPFGQGLYMGDVHSALTELVAWGYLSQEKGAGRRASRYVPVWSIFDSVQKSPNATEDEISVRETPNTSVREIQNATGDSVQKSPNEDPSTGPGPQTRGPVVGSKFETAPVAPPADGLGATAAVPASGDGFPEFWSAWPRKHGKKAAEAEWKKITTDVDIIIDAARTWAEHYAKHGVDKKWIPEPANWLKGGRWDEDLPLIHGDAKGAAIAKAKANAPAKKTAPEPEAANDNVPAEEDTIPDFMVGSPQLWPVGEYSGEFVENYVDEEGKDLSADLLFEVSTPGEYFGKQFRHRFYVNCFVQSLQKEGQNYLSDICGAVGVPSIEDLDDLMFIPLTVRADGRKLTYTTKIQEAA